MEKTGPRKKLFSSEKDSDGFSGPGEQKSIATQLTESQDGGEASKYVKINIRPNAEDHPEGSLEKEIEESLFVPRWDQSGKNYKLYFGPTNLYMFLMYFYSVYERVLKAYDLIEAKIDKDFREDFNKQRWSRKFSDPKKRRILTEERFQYFIKAVYTTMCFSNSLDTNKFEDLSRELLGNEAYLLF